MLFFPQSSVKAGNGCELFSAAGICFCQWTYSNSGLLHGSAVAFNERFKLQAGYFLSLLAQEVCMERDRKSSHC